MADSDYLSNTYLKQSFLCILAGVTGYKISTSSLMNHFSFVGENKSTIILIIVILNGFRTGFVLAILFFPPGLQSTACMSGRTGRIILYGVVFHRCDQVD